MMAGRSGSAEKKAITTGGTEKSDGWDWLILFL
jgi:hypothetical protein